MNQKVRVDLAFDADITAAVTNIEQLNSLLSHIGTKTPIGIDDGPLQRASQSAQQLQIHLQNAVNVNTGKIDLNKLNASLKSANTDLKTLAANLQAAGPAGQQAFLKIATAIASAETPLIKVNKRLKDFGTTLLNTVKWQMASTAIHGIGGMLNSAVHHAEQLNVALNDIRIVTGNSNDEMAKFAMQASSAAKELSTTTTEYAKASLIFYQQGLEGSQVTERADTVIKLSQVTGQSAQVVSDQMTAIWNNFDDGTKSLEYYADALAKLGADTAASTDEIADGLEKFAAVADTVGLSYEYAAASVATVVDKTRQSADVVGTSFKTIFARMQGLQLGETLEDGVDLNKYSEALEKVGVDVLDASGQMREMDDILDDLGAKWQGFGEETKIAIAQTVGGIRQYNQMMALMDNWGSVTDNIEKAKNATGELAKQQSIWSESYTAAANRVKQAQDTLYEKFIDDEAIVKLTDMFAHAIDGVSSFVDALGGAGPMVLMLLGIFSKQLFPVIQAGLTSIKNTWSVWTGTAQQDVMLIQSNAKQALAQMMRDTNMTEGQQQQIDIAYRLLDAKQELAAASKHMTTAQIAEAEARMKNYEAISAQTQATLEKKVALEQELKLMREQMNTGSTKREVAKTAAFDKFRETTTEDSGIDVDSVIDEADGRSMASVQAELAALPTAAELEDRRFQLKQKIASTQQSINDLTANYVNTSDKNVERQTETLAKIEAQEKALAELQVALESVGEEDEERRKHLQAVLDLQKQIVSETKKDISKISVGQVKSSALSDSSFEEGEEAKSLEKGLASQMASSLQGGKEINGTKTEVGEIVSDASLGNLETLYTLMGQYKQSLTEVQAIENDFNSENIQQEIAAKAELASAEEDLAKAKKAAEQASKKGDKNSAAAKKAAENLAKAEQRYAKALKESEKASAKTKKAGVDYQKVLEGTKSKLQDLYKAIKGADASTQDIQELDEAFEALGTGNSKSAIETIVGKMGSLKTALNDAGDSASQMGADMIAALQGGGFKPEQINQFIDRLQQLGIISAETANQMKVLNSAGDGLGGSGVTKGAQIAGVITGIGQVAGTVAMSISTLSNSIATCMSPDTSGMEKAMSVLMALSTLLPTIATAYGFLSGVMKANNALQAEGVAVTGASIGAKLVEMGVISAKTAATWGDTIANIANALSNPWTAAFAAIAIAAIAGVCIWLGSKTKATEMATEAQLEQNKAEMEASEKATELAAKWAEQQDAMDGLIKKYKELKAAGDDYSGTVEDIIEAVPDLIEAYHAAAEGVGIDVTEGSDFSKIEERMKNAAAAGDVEAVEAAQNEMDALISPAAAEAAQKGYTAAVNTLATTLTQTQGSISGNKYSVDVGGAESLFDDGNEEEDAWKYVQQHMGGNATEGGRNFWGNYGGTISMDMGTNDEFMTDYENLMKARDDMVANMSADQLSQSDVYREIDELLKNTEEEYNKAKEMQAEAKKYGVYDAKANLEEQGMDITEIDSLEEYQKYRDALLNDPNVKGDPQAEAVAKQWLEANANVQEYVKAEQKIGYVRDQAGDKVADELSALYDGKSEKFGELTDEQKKLFLEVDFTTYQSEEAVMGEIERLQGIADMEKIELKIEAINTAQDALKETGMTEADWLAVRDSGIEWGKEGVVQFSEFLAMTYSEQQAYLEKIKGAQESTLGDVSEQTLSDLQASLATLEQSGQDGTYDGTDEQYQKEYEAIQANITALQEELAIKEKIADAQAIEDLGLDVSEVEDYAQSLMEAAESGDKLDGISEDLADNAKAAKAVATANSRMNKGLKDLSDNFDDLSGALKNGKKGTAEYNKALKQMDGIMSDVLNLDPGTLSDGFLTSAENLALMEKAAAGDVEAIESLRTAAAKDIVQNCDVYLNGDDAVRAKLDQMAADLASYAANNNLEIGASIDDSQFLAACNEMISAAGMTAEQASNYFKAMGYDAEVEMVTQTIPSKTETYTETGQVFAGMDGDTPRMVTVTGEVTKTWPEQTVQVPAVKAMTYTGSAGGTVDFSNTDAGKSGGGGGGSKPKKAEPSKKSDVVDRYKMLDEQIADSERAMSKASKAADRLWGPSRLAEMKKVNEALEDNIEDLKAKRKEAEKNLEIDRADLEDTVSKEVDMEVTYDAEGNISNYDDIMNSLWDELDAAETKAGDEWDDDEQAEIDAINDRIEAVKAAIEQYDETKDLAKQLDDEIQDKIYEWQDNNYEQLNYELEFKLEIEDSKLEMVEYYLGKIEDDIYATAEAFGYMGQQADIYTNKLEAQGDYVAQLEKDYAAGRISLDAYKEGLRESQSATIENLQALQEQKEAMQDYYGNVMEMALEEIALYTDEMEELNSVLDHYSNILELVGKQEDYATKGKVLNAKAANLRNEMQVQQELYEKSNAEAEKWAAKMATAVEGSNEYETYKKNWIAAQEAANEAQDAMLSKTEEWAEAMKAVVENELAGLAKTMEESLTGGTSFDELLTSMERRSSLQEEYLTTTNQIYETNKLMRQAQQEIDKSSNSVAKRKLQNFINETAQMQEQSELSQYELDIQQAKYDLLLAEIALEEAQSAKSTVRLQRDSEGNFGYVYTADQGAVGEAEQNLADKQNALYNIGLEGANDYTQKYAETMQEAQDAITELTEMWMNGEIESEEEFQRRKAEIQDYYYEKLKQYSSLYQVALTTDSNVIADAWSTDFNDMIYKTDDWKTAVDGYFEGAAVSMGTWADVCATVLEESGLDDVETTVGNITTKSEELKNTLIGEDGESGVVGAMMSEVEAAGELSEAYVGIQNEIDKTIAKYEELLKKINEDYTDPNTETVDPAIDPEDEEEDDTKEDDTKTEEPTTPELKVGSMVTVKKNASKWASGESIWNPVKGNNFKVKKVDGEKILIGDPSGPNYSASGITGWIKKTDLEGFATGGYTGDWEGSYGKLAMLHQKELVLNAGDTENFLAGMDLLDKIVSAIDLYSMNSQLSGALSSPSLGNMGGKDTLEQQVHIEASFPGVQDRNEIEEAFNTLINRASQYANRK